MFIMKSIEIFNDDHVVIVNVVNKFIDDLM